MRMQVDELPQVIPDMDYTQILPIQQKRTIAFVNHFIMNTVSYLNNFAQSCESRFMEFEYKMQKIEASLLILEAQLSSIPQFEKPNNSIANTDKQTALDKSSDRSTEVTLNLPKTLSDTVEKTSTLDGIHFGDMGSHRAPMESSFIHTIIEPPGVYIIFADSHGPDKLPEPEKSTVLGKRACEDSRYIRFFKMLRVGVQEQAVKIKMKSEGFDPSILDNPDALLPDTDSTQESYP